MDSTPYSSNHSDRHALKTLIGALMAFLHSFLLFDDFDEINCVMPIICAKESTGKVH